MKDYSNIGLNRWSPREEEIIAQIMNSEGVVRIEAIRRMRRRRLDDLRGRILTIEAPGQDRSHRFEKAEGRGNTGRTANAGKQYADKRQIGSETSVNVSAWKKTTLQVIRLT